jgi:hypothetical protein
MSNRFAKDFSRMRPPFGPPPIGPDGIQYYLEHGTQERARAIRAGLRFAGTHLLRIAKIALEVVRCSAYGIAKRAPDRLTSTCR